MLTDQISKLWIKGFSIPFLHINHQGMSLGQRIEVIGSFFQITFVENPGMAFGIELPFGIKFWVSLFTVIASAGLLYFLYKSRDKSLSLRIPIALILAGAVGNLIDRVFYGVIFDYAPLFYGHVVDFLDFDFWHFSLFGRSYDRWPVFNVADMAVSVGVLILLFFYKQNGEDKEEKNGETIPEDTLVDGLNKKEDRKAEQN